MVRCRGILPLPLREGLRKGEPMCSPRGGYTGPPVGSEGVGGGRARPSLTALLAACCVALAGAGAAQAPAGAAGTPGALLAQGKALVEQAEVAAAAGLSASAAADQAVELLKACVAEPNPPTEAYYYLGRAYALAGYPRQAVANLVKFLAAGGLDPLAAQAKSYVFTIRFLEGCHAVSAARGRAASEALLSAMEIQPENAVVKRKLDAATSGLYDPSRESVLQFEPEEPGGLPLVVPKAEVFERYAPRALSRLAAGNLAGAGADLDKLIKARGAAAPIAALRTAVYAQLGDAQGAVSKFGTAFADPVDPADSRVFTTRVAAMDGVPFALVRFYGPAVVTSAMLSGLGADADKIGAFFAKHELVAVGVVAEGLLTTTKPERLEVAIVPATGGPVEAESAAVPREVTEALGPGIPDATALQVFPKQTPGMAINVQLTRGQAHATVAFEDPPIAPPQWAEYAKAAPTAPGVGPTVPTPPGVTIEELTSACVPVFSSAPEPSAEGISAVWMTRGFAHGLLKLAGEAPDAGDLKALAMATETHLVFLLALPAQLDGGEWARKAELTASSADRRAGVYLDDLVEVRGLSERSRAYGIAFPIKSRAGRDMPLDLGELTLTFPLQSGQTVTFKWHLPLAEPPLLSRVLGGGSGAPGGL